MMRKIFQEVKEKPCDSYFRLMNCKGGKNIMKRFLNILSVVILLLGLSGAANAYTIDYQYTANGNEFTSPWFATAEDFNTGSAVWTWTGSSAIVSGDLSGQYSAPGGVDGLNKDTTYYVTVPKPASGGNGSVLVTGLPAGTYNYFGLWWGSMDTYNTLTFYLGNVPTGEFVTGTDVATPNVANGNQTSPTDNHYVNFYNLKPYDSFEMSSTQYAFEADNFAIGNRPVPLPAAIWLFGAGLLGLFGVRRRIIK
jgi:hypothetical protein